MGLVVSSTVELGCVTLKNQHGYARIVWPAGRGENRLGRLTGAYDLTYIKSGLNWPI